VKQKILKNTKKTGDLGEGLAESHYRSLGFRILARNYWKKWGEIDVIAQKVGTVHFVEVKTVSHKTIGDLKSSISRGTWRPEENVHDAKLRRLARAIDTWIAENKYRGEWQIDVASVRMVPREKYAVVDVIEKVVLD